MVFQPVIDFIRSLYPDRETIPLHEPYFGGNEKKYLIDCIDSTYVSSVGKYVDRFEEMICEFTGAKYAVATVNGTAALHAALLMAGVQRNDLVITQPLTFIATCNAIAYCGAEPVFIDIDRHTLGLSAGALENWLADNVVLAEFDGTLQCFYLPQMGTNEGARIFTNVNSQGSEGERVGRQTKGAEPITKPVNQNKPSQPSSESFVRICDPSFVNISGLKRISACVPMHTFGHPCEIDRIVEICGRYHIPVVEDSAESIGSYYKGRHTGTSGLLGILSFNGNKTITTGGGGMILTNEDDLGRLAKHLTTTAKVLHAWEFLHDMTGFNYRLPNVNAALGCAQMEMLPQILSRKREIAQRYHTFFDKYSEMTLISEPDHAISNYWLNAILLPNSELRDGFLEESKRSGIMSRPAWTLMNKLNMYSSCLAGELPRAMDIASRLVNLPSSPGWAAPDEAYA